MLVLLAIPIVADAEALHCGSSLGSKVLTVDHVAVFDVGGILLRDSDRDEFQPRLRFDLVQGVIPVVIEHVGQEDDILGRKVRRIAESRVFQLRAFVKKPEYVNPGCVWVAVSMTINNGSWPVAVAIAVSEMRR